MKDLAEMLGVSEEAIRVRKHRGNLPEPDWFVGRSPVWKPETIEEYRRTHAGRTREPG